jgi:predicted adenine nucleotide alpha hydrolase (AANH) superfamily ATPase
MATNYHRILEETLDQLTRSETTPRLLLHCCCAPCSTAVLDLLNRYFEITLLYYNPNIYPEAEYVKRERELHRLLSLTDAARPMELVTAEYRPEAFDVRIAGLEGEPEGGKRCFECISLRMEETARKAADDKYDYFTTTLSVSPHKNAEAINSIGAALALRYPVKYLYADFKKKDGYKRSIELSGEYGLYRQDYCGCRYSYAARHGAPSSVSRLLRSRVDSFPQEKP